MFNTKFLWVVKEKECPFKSGSQILWIRKGQEKFVEDMVLDAVWRIFTLQNTWH